MTIFLQHQGPLHYEEELVPFIIEDFRPCAWCGGFEAAGTNNNGTRRLCTECTAFRERLRCLEDPEGRKAARDRYQKSPRGRQSARVAAQRRLGRKMAKGAPYDREALYEAQGGLCSLCHRPMRPFINRQAHKGEDVKLFATVDHTIPISKGGPDCASNVTIAHWGCNSAKHNKELP